MGVWDPKAKTFLATETLPIHGYKPVNAKCDKVKFDYTKYRKLTGAELAYDTIASTLDGIIWKFDDGTVESTPTSLKIRNPVSISIPNNTTFMGFATRESFIGGFNYIN
jgi:hypothetical protein